MKRNVSVVCVCSAPNCCDTEQRSASNILISGKIIKEVPGSVASGITCTSRENCLASLKIANYIMQFSNLVHDIFAALFDN